MAVRESVLERIHRTCREAVEAAVAAGDVTVEEGAARTAAAELPPPADILAACQFMRLPIRFDSLQAEVNAMALFHLLEFGSGFDNLLLAQTGKDAREAVQFGLLGMLMHGAPLDSCAWMAAFGGDQVFHFFNIDATVDEPVPSLPGVVMSRQGPLGGFTSKLREAVSETGKALAEAGHSSLGELILSNLDSQTAGGQQPSAAALVEELADCVPAFADAGLYRGSLVHFCRKAQLLAAQLHLRFRGTDARFRFADMDQLSVDSGNVLPAVFRRMGVVQLSDSLAEAVDSGKDLQGDERERAIRAATVQAGSAVCKALAAASPAEGAQAGGDSVGSPTVAAVQPWQLSMYLLQQEEQREQRRRQRQAGTAADVAGAEGAAAAAIKRHVARGTVAY